MSDLKNLFIRLLDHPTDRTIKNWLDDVPKYHYGGHGGVIKTVLCEHAQKLGYHSQGSEPEPTPKKVISARHRKERESLGEKAEVGSSVQEESDGLAEYEYLTKLFPNIFNGEKYSGNPKG